TGRYFTYLGGSGADYGKAIAVDESGITITGETGSSDFPIQGQIPGAQGADVPPWFDEMFVTKFRSDWSGLVFSTFIGGDGTDVPHALTLDDAGNSYITGETYSSNFFSLEAFQ